MAIIGTIRKHSALAVVIVGVAIAAFVIGDFGQNQSRGTTDIGAVNGEVIPYLDFNAKVEKNLEIQQENTGTDKVSEEMAYNIRQSTWNDLVRELLMDEELDKLGMGVSSEELFEIVQGQHPHRYILQYFKDPATGAYNPAMVLNYLRNLDQMEPKAKTQWLQFEQAIQVDQLQTKFNTLITKSYYVPKAFLRQQQQQQEKSLSIRYISPNFYTIPDTAVRITDEDYRRFYDKNMGYFVIDEPYVDLDYVLFEVKPSAQDRQQITADVEGLYQDFQKVIDPMAFVNANSDQKFDTGYVATGVFPQPLDSLLFAAQVGSFVSPLQNQEAWYMARLMGIGSRPDSMKGSQLLVTWAELGIAQNVTRTQEQAKKRADSLLGILKANPSRFAELSKEVSDYPTAKEDGGELPWFPDGNPNVSPFFEAGIEMKPNEVQLIETRLGYSLYQLTEKSENRLKVKAAVLTREIDPSTKTFQDYYSRASMFAGKSKDANAFDTSAVAAGLYKRQATGVKEMDNALQGLQNARNLVRWSFAEQTKVGEVSPVFDLQGVYVVALLKDRFAKGTMPLDAVKSRIEPNVRNAKKIELLAGQLEEAMQQGVNDLNGLAARFGTPVDTTLLTFSGMNRSPISREGEVVGQLFAGTPGQLTGPFQGNFGVYVVLIDRVVDAPTTENYSAVARADYQGWNNRVSNSLYESMLKQADIEDNRVLFY